MKRDTLKPLTFLSKGLELRTAAAEAISSVENYNPTVNKPLLGDFFSDCMSKAGGSTNTALVTNTVKIPVGTVTGEGTFGTFTVVNGVVTSIVLSAS